MQRDWKHSYFLAAVAFVAIGAEELMAQPAGPVEWCGTYENWVAKVGNQRAKGVEACPTEGTCDTPPVRDSWILGPLTPIVEIRVKSNIFCWDDGTDCASSPSGVADQMTQLNSDYAPHLIQFTQNTEYINDTTYRVLSSQSEVEAMKNTYADNPAHQLNVYVADTGGVAMGTFPWAPDALSD